MRKFLCRNKVFSPSWHKKVLVYVDQCIVCSFNPRRKYFCKVGGITKKNFLNLIGSSHPYTLHISLLSLIKLWLHKRFVACTGPSDASFWQCTLPARSENSNIATFTQGDRPVVCCKTFNLLNFSQLFIGYLFQLSCYCVRVVRHAIFTAL